MQKVSVPRDVDVTKRARNAAAHAAVVAIASIKLNSMMAVI